MDSTYELIIVTDGNLAKREIFMVRHLFQQFSSRGSCSTRNLVKDKLCIRMLKFVNRVQRFVIFEEITTVYGVCYLAYLHNLRRYTNVRLSWCRFCFPHNVIQKKVLLLTV